MAENSYFKLSESIKTALNVIYYTLCVIILIYTLWIPIEAYSVPFSWHVIISTLSLIPLATEALMLFASDNVWSQGLEKNTKKYMHGILMGTSTVLMITGIAVEIDRGAGIADYPHFTSAHAITGLIALIFLVFGSILGLCALFAQSLKGFLRPVITKFIHNVLGNLTFIFGIVSLCCGFYTNWFAWYTSEASRMAAVIVTAIICVWSLIHSFISGFKQIQAIMNVPVYRGVPIEVQGVNRPLSVIRLSRHAINE
ncbi:Eukaryotic cytochrome b561 [Popillia japonica]|uniref:ascorbate ferrireductase (transmembrane) n=1 Tax=Popillia japonica TaxID=7064 RepID=A0AAW1KHQ5_POPJA